MTGSWEPTPIEGVLRRAASVHPDERGSFAELWRATWTEGLAGPFVQANLSRSRTGVLRGMHYHGRQDDLWLVLDGRAHVALVDVRGGDTGAAVVHAFEAAPGTAVLIPPGVAHGFLALEPLLLGYLVTNEFDDTDEYGFAWDDPLAAIDWPTADPILSPRDHANPPLASALAGWAASLADRAR